ncbi:MAG: hypothetical protein KatS3mg131_2432 [Candidatus Tectimicrobiota bacterium]|nr:MAG: hypothetical protein KatS3mg131_2432 [Candidatus Tectomicrobia bacterium]
MLESLGKLLVGLGILLVLVGLLLWLAEGKLGWFGQLPGDIRVEKPGFRFYAPLTSMLLLSLALSLALWLVGRFLNK